MGIDTVERFHCKRCGYITEDKYQIKQVKKTGRCPACGNGKPKVWNSTYKGNAQYEPSEEV